MLIQRFSLNSMTLTQTERGYPPVIEHVGKPVTVKREMGKILRMFLRFNYD